MWLHFKILFAKDQYVSFIGYCFHLVIWNSLWLYFAVADSNLLDTWITMFSLRRNPIKSEIIYNYTLSYHNIHIDKLFQFKAIMTNFPVPHCFEKLPLMVCFIFKSSKDVGRSDILFKPPLRLQTPSKLKLLDTFFLLMICSHSACIKTTRREKKFRAQFKNKQNKC